MCGSLIGWPRVGSVLAGFQELEPGERLTPCREGANIYRCFGCGAVAVFRPPEGR